jgi:hypothetical protein
MDFGGLAEDGRIGRILGLSARRNRLRRERAGRSISSQ